MTSFRKISMPARGTLAALPFAILLALLFTAGCAFAEKTKATAAAPAKAARKNAESPPLALPPAAQMLQNAGRSAEGPQPEQGFILQVPAEVWAGDPFLVRIGGTGLQKAVIEWRGKTLTIAPGKGNQAATSCEALLPVDLDEKLPKLPLTIKATWASGKQETFTGEFPVKKRSRPIQKLKVAQKFVTPPPEMEEKIKQDRAELRAAISKISPVKYWNLPMLRPVSGDVTSLYGLRRVYNGVPKSPHRGIDFDAMQGDPISAADAGIVVLASEQYYGGNIVIVDHGLGVFSLYLHLSEFRVSLGQKVARGDIIGLVGSTGRSTGPHLHLSFNILGVSVDAAPCIAM